MAVWPGLSPRTQQVFEMVGRGANPVQFFNGYVVRRVQYYHRQVLTKNAAPTSKVYFSSVSGLSAGVTNWPSSNGLQTETAMWLRSLRFGLDISQSLTGAAGAEEVFEDDTTEVIKTMAALDGVLKLLKQGIVTAKVGARVIVDNQYGLQSFPEGSGPHFGSGPAAGTFTAEQTIGAVTINNGEPNAANGYDLGWIPVLPNKAVEVSVNWLSASATIPNQFDVTLNAILDGILIYPQSI